LRYSSFPCFDSVDGGSRHPAEASLERIRIRSLPIRTASCTALCFIQVWRRPVGSAGIIPAVVEFAVLIPLFLFAGKTLAAAGSERGWAFPWIAVSAVCTLPLLSVRAFVIPNRSMEDTAYRRSHSGSTFPETQRRARRHRCFRLPGRSTPDVCKAPNWRSGGPHQDFEKNRLPKRGRPPRAVREAQDRLSGLLSGQPPERP